MIKPATVSVAVSAWCVCSIVLGQGPKPPTGGQPATRPAVKISGVDRAFSADATDINLSYAPVTDAGLEDLAGLKRLTVLVLLGTRVTEAGVKDLRAALPRCEIMAK